VQALNGKSAGIVENVEAQQSANWEVLVQQIAKLDVQETQNALHMGDLLIEVEESFGDKHLQKAAEQAGVSWSVARQRHWVSKRIPKDHPVRKMKSLSFGHLRALAATQEPLKWAKLAEEENLTVRDLTEKIAQNDDVEKIVNGMGACAACTKQVLSEAYVAITLPHGKRQLCCNNACGIQFLLQQGAPETDPFPAPTETPSEAPELELSHSDAEENPWDELPAVTVA
jgi:hypothetical protein